jgi:hypothetical protein
MAQLRLGRHELEEDWLPPLCMRCGEPAALTKRKTFSWYPTWVYLLILVHLLVFLIVALILTKRMTVPVPLCDRHRHQFLWPVLLGVAALLLLLGTIFGGIALVAALDDVLDRDAKDVFFPIWFIGGFGLFLVVLIVACVVQYRTIRAIEITDRVITLMNVAPRFRDAVLAADRPDEEYDRPRPRRRAADSPHVYDPETRPGRPLPPDAYREKEE